MNFPDEKSRYGAGLVLLAAFAMGILAGAALLHMAQLSLGRPAFGRPGPPFPPGGLPGGPPGPPPLEHLKRELDLDRDQVRQIRVIIEESRQRVREEVESTGDRIKAVLTEEQRKRFDDMRLRRPQGPPDFPPPPRDR